MSNLASISDRAWPVDRCWEFRTGKVCPCRSKPHPANPGHRPGSARHWVGAGFGRSLPTVNRDKRKERGLPPRIGRHYVAKKQMSSGTLLGVEDHETRDRSNLEKKRRLWFVRNPDEVRRLVRCISVSSRPEKFRVSFITRILHFCDRLNLGTGAAPDLVFRSRTVNDPKCRWQSPFNRQG